MEYLVPTSFGPISVTVCGDLDKCALVTYPDVGLNYLSCFEGLFSTPEASSVLFHNFCIYHIDPPGHEVGAPEISPDQGFLSVDDLADQVAEVVDYFGINEVIGLGATAGAYVLSLFACKYPDRALGLILVSPVAQCASWTEWLQNQAMINLLYFCGMTHFVRESLIKRYFGSEVRDAAASVGGADMLKTLCQYMDNGRSENVMRYLQAIHRRRDLTEDLKVLRCRTLILVGEESPFHHETLHMSNAMNRRYNALIEVEGCGSLVTEERPQSMLVPIELFLTGYAFYQRPSRSVSSSPSSPLSSLCVAAELLSPESLGVKLKPIKTRVCAPMQ
nr:protein NDL2-like isoform X2 [Physcomitrium patens]|eukprot:XP_024396275.1 protein NDL2-like isoform X2 [Physcomitrella patens]